VDEPFKLAHGGRKKLIRRWNELLIALGLEPDDYFSILDDLLTRYTQPHRVYHNLDHLAAMFALMPAEYAEQAVLDFATWFHDAVYDPTRGDNEEQSAVLARKRLEQMRLPQVLIQQVEQLILATRTHTATDPATALLLDADLTILGADERVYHAYSRAIRQEYAWVSEEAYRAGRTEVLQSFLARKKIYQTPGFAHLEAPARENLGHELKRLRGLEPLD